MTKERNVIDIPIHELRKNELAQRCGEMLPAEESEPLMAALTKDIEQNGIRTPLVVVPAIGKEIDDAGQYEIVDGCSRFDIARSLDIDPVPCEVLPAGTDVADEVYRRNLVRKAYSASQRAALYVDMHRGEVLAAAESDKCKGGRPSKSETGTKCTGFSAASICERTGLSKPDVVAAIEMVRCVNAGLIPRLDKAGNVAMVEANAAEHKLIDQAYLRVVVGDTPVRRWRPALTSMSLTKGKERGRNFEAHAFTSVKSFGVVWQKDWPHLDGEAQHVLIRELQKSVSNLSVDLLDIIIGCLKHAREL